MKRLILAGGLVALFATACGSGSPPGPSSLQTLNLSGRWSGTMSDSSGGPGPVSLVLSQNGNGITGTFTADGFGGTVTGTLTGTTLTLAAVVPRGGVVGEPNCSMTANGTAAGVTDTAINGTYSGTNSCSGSFTNGRMSLTKR